MRKAVYDRSVPTRNLITTISGIAGLVISLVVSVLIATGKVDQEQSLPLTEALNGIVTASVQVIGYVTSLILIFKAKDA
jgi:flagellar biosynthesis protein FliQ